jgi:L-ascorbate metabolism protein UlaG (beta-lactamase superfamily)
MHILFLRHAALIADLGGTRILVDPMLGPARSMDPVANAANANRIPLVDLPLAEAELRAEIGRLAGVLVTHVHRDHWDAYAREVLPRDLPVLCQPVDEAALREAGFTEVLPVEAERPWRGLHIRRTGGRHGTGEIGQKMGHVSGFVLQAPERPGLYIAGDTIWCPEVGAALQAHAPSVVVVNAGAAQFLTGDPITMTADDVVQVCRARPDAQVVAVHMEAVNHCGLTRAALRERLAQAGCLEQVSIPADGALLAFPVAPRSEASRA